MLYRLHHAYSQVTQPVHLWAQAWRKQLTLPWNPLRITWTGRTLTAAAELLERCTDNYEKPEFGFTHTEINGEQVRINEEIVHALPFCDLKCFRRAGEYQHPKVLIVAPMSGHYATLLRGTVEQFLPDHEVYITDWINAREVPASEGGFSFDDYVSYLIEFMQVLGPDTHMIAVCQPSVPAIVATSVMSEQQDPCAPQSLILMGGPIDTRVNPTEVNDYASGKDYEWFEKHVICTVPNGFPGSGQKVYPGFIQLSGFMSMNMDSHISKHFRFFGDLIKGDGDNAEAHRKFYNEYLAVMDLPADFYLDTIKKVFLDHELAKGEITFKGRLIEPGKVTQTALMTVEGENDDITGMGQTEAAHKVLSGLSAEKRLHYVQPEVGHYGIFNGRRFREEVAPQIKAFIQKHSTDSDAKTTIVKFDVELNSETAQQKTPTSTAEPVNDGTPVSLEAMVSDALTVSDTQNETKPEVKAITLEVVDDAEDVVASDAKTPIDSVSTTAKAETTVAKTDDKPEAVKAAPAPAASLAEKAIEKPVDNAAIEQVAKVETETAQVAKATPAESTPAKTTAATAGTNSRSSGTKRSTSKSTTRRKNTRAARSAGKSTTTNSARTNSNAPASTPATNAGASASTQKPASGQDSAE